MIARVAETSPRTGHGTGRPNGHSENTRDIQLAGRLSVGHGSAKQSEPSGLSSRIILLVLVAILDLFITLSISIGQPVDYFCPVLTADGKLDCAPK